MTQETSVLRKLPLWSGAVGAVWMVVEIKMMALRAISIIDYVGFRTGMMFPTLGREPTRQDAWVLNSWLVLTSGIEFLLLGFLIRFAIVRFGNRSKG